MLQQLIDSYVKQSKGYEASKLALLDYLFTNTVALETVTKLYRGTTVDGITGTSWTTNRRIAECFADLHEDGIVVSMESVEALAIVHSSGKYDDECEYFVPNVDSSKVNYE